MGTGHWAPSMFSQNGVLLLLGWAAPVFLSLLTTGHGTAQSSAVCVDSWTVDSTALDCAVVHVRARKWRANYSPRSNHSHAHNHSKIHKYIHSGTVYCPGFSNMYSVFDQIIQCWNSFDENVVRNYIRKCLYIEI